MAVGTAADPTHLAVSLRADNDCLFLLHSLPWWVLDHRCGVIARNPKTIMASALCKTALLLPSPLV